MRKIILEIAPSVDGLIEGTQAEMDWLVPDDEEGLAYAQKFLSGFDTIFFGRKTYEKFNLLLSDETRSLKHKEIYETVNKMRKYVFTRTKKHVEGNGMVIGDDLIEEVQRIRNENGKDIWLCGGTEIIKTFVELGLIDEYRLAIQPRLLSSGKLDFLKSERLPSGVVVLHYENRKIG